MEKLTIIGNGRFAKTLFLLLHNDFDIIIYQRFNKSKIERIANLEIKTTSELSVAYESKIIFFAVPISQFESVVKQHLPYFTKSHILIDVLSVKLLPEKIFRKYSKVDQPQVILTHPMFGPDSSKDGFSGLPIVMHNFNANTTTYNRWKNYFTTQGLKVMELTPDQHDKFAAESQGLTHFIGRLLEEIRLKKTPIDTLGTQKLIDIEAQTTNDSWQLFTDLQHFNPYTRTMRLNLGRAYDIVYNKLLPEQRYLDYITIGIQGGKGSFNEEAVQYWLGRNGVTNYKIKYLYTTNKVLLALHSGEIDRGLFAIHNSVGGIVEESVLAMSQFKFSIVEEFAIKISHALMIRKDATLNDITTIMAHPQVFAQCRDTLSQKYPQLTLKSGEGDLIDHAIVAKHLSKHKLSKNIATMGSQILAEIYNLTIVEDNLQDASQNYTSFLLVKR